MTQQPLKIMSFAIVSSPKLPPYASVTLADGSNIHKPLTREMLLSLIIDAARAVGNIDHPTPFPRETSL